MAGEDDDEEGEKGMSKRQRKKLTRLSVAELKQLVVRPDVVEVRTAPVSVSPFTQSLAIHHSPVTRTDHLPMQY